MKKKLVNGSLVIMIAILALAIAAYLWSVWEHQQNLYFHCPVTDMTVRRTGMDSLNFISPIIGYFIFLVIIPITLIIVFVRRKIMKAECRK